MAKGLVSNSSRAQALSYRRYAPNPIGVTAIAAVNGRGAYGRNAGPVVRVKRGSKVTVYRGAKAKAYLALHPQHKKHQGPHNVHISFTTEGGQRVTVSPRGRRRPAKPKVVTRTRTRTITRTVRSSKTKRASTKPITVTIKGRRKTLRGGAARAWRERKGARLGSSSRTSYRETYSKAKKALAPKKRGKKAAAKKTHHRRPARIHGSPVIPVGGGHYAVVREYSRNKRRRTRTEKFRSENWGDGGVAIHWKGHKTIHLRRERAELWSDLVGIHSGDAKQYAIAKKVQAGEYSRNAKKKRALLRRYRGEIVSAKIGRNRSVLKSRRATKAEKAAARRNIEDLQLYRARRHDKPLTAAQKKRFAKAIRRDRALDRRWKETVSKYEAMTPNARRHRRGVTAWNETVGKGGKITVRSTTGKRVTLSGAAAKAYRRARGNVASPYHYRLAKALKKDPKSRIYRSNMHENASTYAANKKKAAPKKKAKKRVSHRGWRKLSKAQRRAALRRWDREGAPITMGGTVSIVDKKTGKYKRLRGARAKAWAKKHLTGARRAKFLKAAGAESRRMAARKGKPSRKASRYRRNEATPNRAHTGVHYRPMKVGGKKLYLMRTKGGKYRHAPVYRQLGYKTEKAMAAAVGRSDKTAARVQKRLQAIRRRREAAAKKMLRRGPSVHGKHVPPYKALGFKSQHAMAKVLQGKDHKAAERVSRRLEALLKKRRTEAAKILKHGDRYTPNARTEEWSTNTMEPNKRKGRKSKGRRKGARRKTPWTAEKRRAAAKKAARTRKAKHARRSAAAKKGYRRNEAGYEMNKGHFEANKRRGKKGKGRRKGKKLSAAMKRKMRAGWLKWYKKKHHKAWRPSAKTHRRGKGKKGYRRNESAAMVPNRHFHDNRRFNDNRRGGMARYHDNRGKGKMAANRRHYRPNTGSKEFVGQLKEALKIGAIGTGGFLVHRGLSYYLSENLLTKIGVFMDATTPGNTNPGSAAGSMAAYRRIVAGAAVALVGVPLSEKIAPKQATPIAAGMVVSFLHQLIVTAVAQFQPTLVPAISGYGDQPGKAFTKFRGGYGEYFMTPTGRGMGEYFMMPGATNGFGAYGGGVRQAAAGFGRAPMVTQAAAAFGRAPAMRRAPAPLVSQAAAGFGAHGPPHPLLSQAAAGVGEFFMTNPQGIGDYEQVTPPGSGAMHVTDDGIPGGDTHAAEHALSIAEAASGIGAVDEGGVGVQSIVDPIGVAVPVSDEPGGTRAGLFAGSEGIFG